MTIIPQELQEEALLKSSSEVSENNINCENVNYISLYR
jgi:hypothetical protein